MLHCGNKLITRDFLLHLLARLCVSLAILTQTRCDFGAELEVLQCDHTLREFIAALDHRDRRRTFVRIFQLRFHASRAEIGFRAYARAAQFIRAEVPGCGQGRLRAFGTQIGVRETRRVEGDHVLTAPELMTPVEFPDTIAMGAYPIDIHPASGAGLDYRALGEHHAYGIPLRCLLPKGLTNALVAGRGISATHEALAAVRVMPIAMALGQAAGTAAALSLAHGGDVRRVDVTVLQARLRADSALLA